MKIKLVVDGERQWIKIEPENDGDRKLLEFTAEKNKADIETKRKFDYSDRPIEYINLVLKVKPEERESRPERDYPFLVGRLQDILSAMGYGCKCQAHQTHPLCPLHFTTGVSDNIANTISALKNP